MATGNTGITEAFYRKLNTEFGAVAIAFNNEDWTALADACSTLRARATIADAIVTVMSEKD